MLRFILFAVLAFIIIRLIRAVVSSFKQSRKDLPDPPVKTRIKNEDIIEAEFKEIENTKNEEKKD